MLGRLAIVIAHFNFSNSEQRELALLKCLNSISPVADIYLVYHNPFNNNVFQLDNVTYFEINRADTLWQRERFWNIALRTLPDYYENIAWIDSDLIFPRTDWIEELPTKLEKFNLVQLFSRITDISSEEGKENIKHERKSIGKLVVEGQIGESYFSTSGISLSLGCAPGFAWAAKAKALRKCKFPDFLILGSGDKAFLAAVLGHQEVYASALHLNENLRLHYLSWSEVVFSTFERKVGYVDNDIYHIVQGDYKNRQYGQRYKVFQNSDFSVDDSLYISNEGAWCWESNCSSCLKVKDYFQKRGD